MRPPDSCLAIGRIVVSVVLLILLSDSASHGQMDLFRTPEQRRNHSAELAREARQLQAESIRWKGMEASVQAGIKGDELLLQNRIADLLNAMDLAQAERTRHFGKLFRDPSLKLTGWYGAIRTVSPDPKGLIVTVDVLPRTNQSGSLLILSRTIERYRFEEGKLHFLDLTYQPGPLIWN